MLSDALTKVVLLADAATAPRCVAQFAAEASCSRCETKKLETRTYWHLARRHGVLIRNEANYLSAQKKSIEEH
jgi:hypothetical protein